MPDRGFCPEAGDQHLSPECSYFGGGGVILDKANVAALTIYVVQGQAPGDRNLASSLNIYVVES